MLVSRLPNLRHLRRARLTLQLFPQAAYGKNGSCCSVVNSLTLKFAHEMVIAYAELH